MKAAGKTHHRTLERITGACRALAMLLLALVSALIVLQVVCRNLFDLGLPWADELARFSGIALVFLAVPALALQGRHVTVDLIPQTAPPGFKRLLRVAGETATLLFAALVLYGFHSFLTRAGTFSTPALGLPNWLFYAPALTGMLLLGAVAMLRLSGILSGRDGDAP